MTLPPNPYTEDREMLLEPETRHFTKKSLDADLPDGQSESVVEAFAAMARRYPEHPAVVEWDGESEHVVSYGELELASSRLAGALPLDPGKPSRIAILIDSAIGHLTAYLGALRAGHAAVPIDPSTPLERVRSILERADLPLVLSDQASDNGWRSLPLECLMIEDLRTSSTLYAGPYPSLDNVAQIIYTSGSTGKPKGVVQSHRYLSHKTWSETSFYGYRREDRLSQLFPLSFAASNGHTFGALVNGGTLYPYDVSKAGLHHLPEWVARYGITGLAGAPTLFRRALSGVDDPNLFRSVRFLMLGGEMVLPADQASFLGLLPADAVLIHRLAATEVGEIARFRIDRSTPRFQTAVPAGTPPPDKEILIVADDGTPVLDGEVGELWVRSEYISEGYWADEAATAVAFSADSEGMRTYRSGDLARRDERGYIFHLGRKDNRIKIRGLAVDLVEVETVFLGVEGIAEGAVKAFDRPSGDTLLAGYFTGSDDLSPAKIRGHMARLVPDYMIPSVLVPMEAMPITPRGKIDRKALPDPGLFMSSGRGAAPETDLERSLHTLWTQALGIEDFSTDQSFFDLGGTSIQAYDLIARIFRDLKVDLPPSTLLKASTIKDQARLIESGEARSAGSLVPIRRGGAKLPLFGVHGEKGGIIFMRRLAEHLEGDRPIYALQPEIRVNIPPSYLTVDEMAAHYLNEIQSVQPHGPYLLLGSCLGGLVAREIARLLKEQAESVALLVMVDPPTPGPKPIRPPEPWTWTKVRRGVEAKTKKSLKSVRRVWQKLQRPVFVERADQLKALHHRARAEYRPQPSSVPVLLLASRGSSARHRDNWAKISIGGLEVQEFPAFHTSMWDAANRKVIAGILNRRLEELDV